MSQTGLECFKKSILPRHYWEDFEVLSNGVEVGVVTNPGPSIKE